MTGEQRTDRQQAVSTQPYHSTRLNSSESPPMALFLLVPTRMTETDW